MPMNISMKLDKSVVQRRLDLMAAEGIVSNFSVLIQLSASISLFRLLFQMHM
jgi:hypothetical protein